MSKGLDRRNIMRGFPHVCPYLSDSNLGVCDAGYPLTSELQPVAVLGENLHHPLIKEVVLPDQRPRPSKKLWVASSSSSRKVDGPPRYPFAQRGCSSGSLRGFRRSNRAGCCRGRGLRRFRQCCGPFKTDFAIKPLQALFDIKGDTPTRRKPCQNTQSKLRFVERLPCNSLVEARSEIARSCRGRS